MISQPSILKYTQSQHVGLQTVDLQRHCIGYVLRGRRRICRGDICQELSTGDLYYLPPGAHTFEELPEGGKPVERIVCYFTALQLCQIMADIQKMRQITFSDELPDDTGSYIVCSTDQVVQTFFAGLESYLHEGEMLGDKVVEQFKLSELIYLLITRPDCPVGVRLKAITTHGKDDFEYIIRSNILSDLSIEELAEQCHRSLTSFKKDFRALFREPPHRWLTGQRLLQSRQMLRSTDMPVAQVAHECRFSTPSHFIKQFKRAYGVTPAAYRRSNS